MNDIHLDDLDELVRRADPIDRHEPVRPSYDRSMQMERIMAAARNDVLEQSEAVGADVVPIDDARTRRFGLRLAAAAAAAVVAGAALVVLDPGSTSTAYALVTDAASDAAAAESGRIVGHAEILEIPGSQAASTVEYEYRFSGADYHLRYDRAGTADDAREVEVIGAGGVTYLAGGDGTFISDNANADSEIGALYRIDPTTFGVDAALRLVRSADDFEQQSATPEVSVFEGVVSTDDLVEFDTLPLGLSLFGTTADRSDLPPTAVVEVTLNQGVLDSVEITLEGETLSGRTDVSLTVEFEELGVAQSITAPPSENVIDEVIVVDSPTQSQREQELLAIILDMTERVGFELCQNHDFPGDTASPEEMNIELNRYVDCLEDAGEAEAADAYREYWALED